MGEDRSCMYIERIFASWLRHIYLKENLYRIVYILDKGISALFNNLENNISAA